VVVGRWRSFPYGACSAPCGGGQQIRHVQCVMDSPVSAAVTVDTDQPVSFFDDVIIVPDERCNASTSPARTSLCNLAPCPPAWSIDSWSEVRRLIQCEWGFNVCLSVASREPVHVCCFLAPAAQPLHSLHYGHLSINRWLATDVRGLRTVCLWTLIYMHCFDPWTKT